jgi:hypothetical protein
MYDSFIQAVFISLVVTVGMSVLAGAGLGYIMYVIYKEKDDESNH